MRIGFVAWCAIALAAAACGDDGSPVSPDSGARADAGRADSGTVRDSGHVTIEHDAGGALDAGEADAAEDVDAGPPPPLQVLVFTHTTGYWHRSIVEGSTALEELAIERGWVLESTVDPSRFDPALLATIDVIVFLNTTGDVLDSAGESALEAWVRAGGGWVGIHSAADTEYDWPFYGELVGAWFRSHPAVQTATIHVEDRAHPATAHLDATWVREDEWYDFRANPRGTANVLLTIDESTYTGGLMGADHPIAWYREIDAGRSLYTAGGHTPASFSEPAFRAHLVAAIEWAGRRR